MTAPAPHGIAGDWKLTWRDEFDHALEPKMVAGWAGPLTHSELTPPMSPPGEVAPYDPACVTIEKSLCTLRAVAKPQELDGIEYEYATGLIVTVDAVFAPGDYVEWRANFSGRNHAALWTSAYPGQGECDTCEWLDGQPTCNAHWVDGGADSGGAVPGTWTGWHTFGSLFTPGFYDTYFDGRRVKSLDNGGMSDPQRLIASVQLDQWAPIVVPDQLHIDYVRVWTPDQPTDER